jgi:hypothetical protein
VQYCEFERSIASPALKEVAAHWHEARRDRRMPAWSDIKPSRIAHHLSLVWSFRYDAARDDFFGRLVGDRISRHIGKDFRGLPLAEAYPPDAAEWVRARFRRVAREPALYNHAGTVVIQRHQPGQGERVLMPLSEDGVTADGVLGATILHDANAMPLTLVEPDAAAERWFSLTA